MAGTATPTATPEPGNGWLQGIIGDRAWSSAGAGTTVSVYIAGLGGRETVSLVGQTITALGGISAAELAAMERAMDAIAAVANVTFVRATSQAGADIIWASVGDDDADGALGWANPPGGAYSTTLGDHQSVIAVNRDAYSGAPVLGSFDYVTFLHEFGHAMGLMHPHDTGGGSTIFPGVSEAFGDFGTHDMNQGIATTMTYNDGWQTAPHGPSPSDAWGYQGTPMALDIAALQFLYGANMATNAGNTVYALPGANGSGTHYAAIWDAGGVDRLVGAASRSNVIDLRAATLGAERGAAGFVSHADAIHGGFTIAHGVVIENATGGGLADIITGNPAANTLEGLAGSDRLEGGAGNDTLLGGFGADHLVGGAGADVIAGGGDADHLVGGAGDDRLDGGAGGDTFAFEGLFGADVIGLGADVGARDNVIRVGSGVTAAMISVALVGGGAHLLVTVAGVAVGQVGTILIEGWAAAQAAGGGFGSVVWAATGGGRLDLTADLDLDAGAGDPVDGGGPAPMPAGLITGTAGVDILFGTEGRDVVHGLAGNDNIRALGGADTVDAGPGEDVVAGGAGDDLLIGGHDDDRLGGEAGDDVLEGGSGRDRLDGGDGNDRLDGGAHDDALFGGAGDDGLQGGAFDDTLDGGDGRDNLDGDAGRDRLLGGAGDDVLDGGRDADHLRGGDGTDILRGGVSSGDDILVGDGGDDTLDGGGGRDRLDGGAGNDLLSGGAGADVYVFAGAFGHDTIVGFDDTAENRRDGLDRIDLSAFRNVNGGMLVMADVHLVQGGAGVVLSLDLDGDGLADAGDHDGDTFADLVSVLIVGATVAAFSAHDFVL